MCCWFCGKVGYTKVDCVARQKRRNMSKRMNKAFIESKRMNKAFIESKRIEKVLLAKCGSLDKIKEKTSEEGCNSVRVSFHIDQEALIMEPEEEVVHGTNIKVRRKSDAK